MPIYRTATPLTAIMGCADSYQEAATAPARVPPTRLIWGSPDPARDMPRLSPELFRRTTKERVAAEGKISFETPGSHRFRRSSAPFKGSKKSTKIAATYVQDPRASLNEQART